MRYWWGKALSLCLITGAAPAASLGVVGDTFPITELSFLDLIESRLTQLANSNELKALESQWVEDVYQYANRPKPLNLPRTSKTYTHHYTPQVVLGSDVLDAKGRVLFQKGTRVNALEQLPTYQPQWFFLDADDKAQVQWAMHSLQMHPDAKMILTGGEVASMERVLKTAVYFDQAGRISNQLGIQHVPVYVSRDGVRLKITEVAIGENGRAR